jgi:F0F1-type ATP synthase assembly protein I
MKVPRGGSEGVRVLGTGLTLAVTVGLFAFAGLWLDERLGTKPLFLLAGVLLGVVGGGLHLLRALAPEMLPFGKTRRDESKTNRAPRK